MSSLNPRSGPTADSYRFGAFEVRGKSGLLLHNGARVRIQELPLRMLLVLIEHAGEVVSREQLRHHLWGKRTFVEFDSGLRVAAAKLREALGDDAAQPQFLETVVRRGYRFIGEAVPVTEPVAPPLQISTESPAATPLPAAPDADSAIATLALRSTPTTPATSERHPRRGWWPFAWGLVAAAVISTISGWIYWQFHRPLLQRQDAVALGRFLNRTQDRSLDEVLSTPFRIKMYESPYLKLVSSDRYAQALKSHPDASLSDELEICRRLHARVLLTGEVVPAGQNFEVRVDAYDCVQTTRVAAATVWASSPDNLLTALQAACNKMRLRLGESRATLNRFDVSLVKATTSSLAALRAYRLGEQQHLSGNDAESKTYFKLAIDLDPKFALAYLQLGRAYSNTGEASLSRSYYQHAFDLRERTTDRERLYITTSYYSYATGERERAIEAYQLWSMLYPQDVIPPNNLAGEYLAIGQPHEALRSARRALEIDPSLPQPHAVVAEALLATGDSATLQTMCDDPVRQATVGEAAYHLTCYNAAFARHDDDAMQREMAWARGKSLECVFINAAAEIALYHGRLDESHRLFDAARQSALANNLPEFAARMGLNEAAMEAELGLLTAARHDALDALAIGPDGPAEEATVALVWALLGDQERANEAMRKAKTHSPLDTLLNHAAIPEVQAVIDLKRNQPEEALRQLEQARPYDLCQSMDLTPGYYRGVAYLQSGQTERAAAEFRNVLNHRATASHSLYVLLSQLQLAKILSQSKDPGAAVVLTRELEENWQEADPGFAPRRDLRTLTTKPRRN